MQGKSQWVAPVVAMSAFALALVQAFGFYSDWAHSQPLRPKPAATATSVRQHLYCSRLTPALATDSSGRHAAALLHAKKHHTGTM